MKTSKTSVPLLHATKQLLVDIDNLSVQRGHELALEGVSLCIHAGEFIGIIGPNGAGKTTLLRVMLGLLKPTHGTVGRQAVAVEYIPQRSAPTSQVPMSVLEVVRLGAHGNKDEARAALAAVKMSDFASRRFGDLSGGQQQRVAIAKALAGHAAILMLDEPTTGIDEQSQSVFYDILQTLQQQGITIVMVSHDVDTVLQLVTRVICLNQSVVYDGAPEHFEADKYLPKLYKTQHRLLHHHHALSDESKEHHA
jgi:zinc transport system ATP-binding protein